MNSPYRQMPLAFPFRKDSTFASFYREPANLQLLDTLLQPHSVNEFPLYLWGEPGCGRSHLLQALCLEQEECIYLPTAELVGLSPELLAGMESLRLVCIDDAHLLAGHRRWQEAVFRLFNSLREQGGRLVVTADVPVAELALELEDLRSRLAWGLVFQVHSLSDEGKSEVLKEAAAVRGITLSDELINYILQRAERRMDRLMALLERLDALSLIEKRRITQPFIRNIMGW